MDPLSTAAFAALVGVFQGVAEGVTSELTAGAIKSKQAIDPRGTQLREFLESDRETYRSLLDHLRSGEFGTAEHEFRALTEYPGPLQDRVRQLFQTMTVDQTAAVAGGNYGSVIAGSGNAGATGQQSIAQAGGGNVASTGPNSPVNVDKRRFTLVDRAMPYVALVGIVALAFGFVSLRSSINNQSNEIGDINNSVNVVAGDVNDLSTDMEDAQGRIDSVEGRLNSTVTTSPDKSEGPLDTTVTSFPLEKFNVVRGSWRYASELSSRDKDYTPGEAVADSVYSSQQSVSTIVEMGQPWVSISGSFFSDRKSTSGELCQLQILDPNSSENLWTSDRLPPGDSREFTVTVSGHAQIEFRFAAYRSDGSRGSCVGGVAATVSK